MLSGSNPVSRTKIPEALWPSGILNTAKELF